MRRVRRARRSPSYDKVLADPACLVRAHLPANVVRAETQPRLAPTRTTSRGEGGAIIQSTGGSHGRVVRLVKLDVATAQRDRPSVVDSRSACAQLDSERVSLAWFALVRGLDEPVDITEPIRPGRATNPTATGRVARRAIGPWEDEVPRDGGPVNVQACAVVDVLQMTPQPVVVSALLA